MSKSLVCVFLLAAGVYSQTPDTATIQGQVIDPSRAAVSGVRVVARNTQSGWERAAVSDAAGNYSLAGLPVAGTYEITAAKQGFAGAQSPPGVQDGTSVPPSVLRPAAPPLPPVPPLPPAFAEPPAPVVTMAPSHESGWSRRPQARPEHPRTTTNTSRRSIVFSPFAKIAGCIRAREHSGPERRRRPARRRRAPRC